MEELTQKEQQVLQMIANGQSTKEICRELDIGEATVRTHMDHIRRALGAVNKPNAVRIGMERGLIE